MAIYLVQHGQCLIKEEDPQKGLSQQGIEDVQRIAKVAATYAVQVSEILHSGKKRAQQTAELMADALKPDKGTRSVDGIKPLDDILPFAESLDVTADEMIVGHLPFLERLAAYLITGQHQRPVFQLQNGGILCLDYYTDSEQIVVKWALMPKVG
jgi:phosphohistidine phosphatase